MSSISKRLRAYLDDEEVGYSILHHDRRYTAQHTAQVLHTPGSRFAKTIFVWLDGLPAMVVVPAPMRLDLQRLKEITGAEEIDLATEDEMGGICHDCELGAEPPFGNLYDLPVYLSADLVGRGRITFNAGTHEDAIQMSYRDYERLVEPLIVDLSTDH